jgi:hypothetical protein
MQKCVYLIKMGRKLIHSAEEKISFLQIIGFIVILFGLVYLFIVQILNKLNGETIAIDFFTIMLGIAFAFPDLLRDSNKGLSTMRIIVFMLINVICLLLLKIGWAQPNLKAIGLDQYWVGVIAFIFGAKATQSYFESKMANISNSSSPDHDHDHNLPAVAKELDVHGVVPTKLTTDTELSASKGSME